MTAARCVMLWVLAIWACSPAPTAPSVPRAQSPTTASAEPTPAPAAAAAAPAPGASPATPAPDPLATLGARLASDWCQRGFGFPSARDPMPGCERVEVEIRERRTSAELEAAVIALGIEGPSHSEELQLYLRRGERAGTTRLAHAWSSGVGAFSHEIAVHGIQLQDITGDEAPEWWAEIEVESHDTDAGDCRTRGSLEQSLVLCTSEKQRLSCSRLSFTKLAYEEIWADASAAGCARPRFTSDGYAARVSVSRDGVRLEPLSKTPDGRALTRARKAPARGRLSIAQLLRRFPAEVVLLEAP